jgi:hypothetical protein
VVQARGRRLLLLVLLLVLPLVLPVCLLLLRQPPGLLGLPGLLTGDQFVHAAPLQTLGCVRVAAVR